MQEDLGHIPLLRLLSVLSDAIVDELTSDLDAAGYGLRPGHGCVFGNIRPEGARLTDLAARAGMTKQAVGEVVAELERDGYLEREPDPSDGRAKIVRLTEKGAEAQARGNAVLDAVEARWAEAVGPERLAEVRAVLGELAQAEHPELLPPAPPVAAAR